MHMQGWTTDFIPKLTSDALAAGYVHETLPTSGFDAIQCSKDLAQKEGIFTGISGGGTFAAALQASICASSPTRVRTAYSSGNCRQYAVDSDPACCFVRFSACM
jgi:cysteine synthase